MGQSPHKSQPLLARAKLQHYNQYRLSEPVVVHNPMSNRMASEMLTLPRSDITENRLDLPTDMELDKTGERTKHRAADKWKTRVSKQGPWNQKCTPKMLSGTPALPMPIQISAPSSLAPFFHHLECNGSTSILPDGSHKQYSGASQATLGKEPNHDIPIIEYEKGVIYADRRMDLCKMGVGPLNIDALMNSLDNNTFVKHFLFGNNIVGPAGVRRITRFIQDHPDRIETWYLAGNCIDRDSFSSLVNNLIDSVADNVWLKRNPLATASAPHIARLIGQSSHLHTLDLDQTELGDRGVAASSTYC